MTSALSSDEQFADPNCPRMKDMMRAQLGRCPRPTRSQRTRNPLRLRNEDARVCPYCRRREPIAEVALVKFHTLFHPKLGTTVDAVTMIENA